MSHDLDDASSFGHCFTSSLHCDQKHIFLYFPPHVATGTTFSLFAYLWCNCDQHRPSPNKLVNLVVDLKLTLYFSYIREGKSLVRWKLTLSFSYIRFEINSFLLLNYRKVWIYYPWRNATIHLTKLYDNLSTLGKLVSLCYGFEISMKNHIMCSCRKKAFLLSDHQSNLVPLCIQY